MDEKKCDRTVNLTVRLREQRDDEALPDVALYLMGTRGRAVEKLAEVRDDQVPVPVALGEEDAVIALGPDTDDPEGLDPSTLVQLRALDVIERWPEKIVDIPALRWRVWLPIFICVSGKAQKCGPLFPPILPLVDVQVVAQPQRAIELIDDLIAPFPPRNSGSILIPWACCNRSGRCLRQDKTATSPGIIEVTQLPTFENVFCNKLHDYTNLDK